MKNYDEFIKEDNNYGSKYNTIRKAGKLLEGDYDLYKKISEWINKDAKESGIFQTHFYSSFDVSHPQRVEMENDKIILIPLHMELSLSHVEGDIVEYFNKVKEFFKKYHYVKMLKASSTNYYDVLLDYKKLTESNLFRSLKGKHRFKI